MNPLTKPVLLAAAGVLLGVLFATAALTNDPPTVLSQPLIAGSDGLHPTPFSSVPIIHPGRPSPSEPPLKPGVYQTRPYAMILVVPETGLDDRCVIGGISADSKGMPVIHPDQQAIPKTDSK